MKKFLKYLLLLFLISFIILIIIFRNRLSLTYNLLKYSYSLKDSVAASSLNNMKSLNSMDYKDITYKVQNGKKETLDIYCSKKKSSKASPVIIYIHGGSWAYGDKNIPSFLSPILEMFREQGYTIISPSYELMKDKIIFNKQISDVKDTIRWVNKNKTKYNLNTNEIGLIGVSSGAHLSLISAYSNDNDFIGDETLKNYSSKVKYIIDFSGPTDLASLDVESNAPELNKIIKSLGNRKEIINMYNPLKYINNSIPPTLVIHSKADTMVPYSNSYNLYNKIIQYNNRSKLVTLTTCEHTLENLNKEDLKKLAIETLKFIINNSPL